MRKKGFLKYAIFIVLAMAVINMLMEIKRRVDKRLTALNTYKAYYDLTLQWMKKKDDISQYFRGNNYKTIGIYGLGTLGELFYENISSTDVKIACFIEKEPLRTEKYYIPMAAVNEASLYEDVDAIIVTPINSFSQIKNDLVAAGAKADIVSLDTVIYGA